MTHSQTKELSELDRAFKTVGLDKRQHERRNYLMSTHAKEVEALSNKLNHWAHRTSTRE